MGVIRDRTEGSREEKLPNYILLDRFVGRGWITRGEGRKRFYNVLQCW